jgi:tripartite-type tricarboxylate transporter receptor subunit TctC
MKKIQALLISLILSLLTSNSWGQNTFPNKPVHIIIPFPPGGSTDVLGRLLGASMSNNLGQIIVIENTGGAGGTIGAAKVARAPGDGYTLLFHNMAHASTPALYSKLSYSPVSDFEAIGIVTEVPMILVARKNFPANRFSEVLSMAKANGNSLNFANAGVGATSQLCEALLKSTTNSQWTSVPYKGIGPALNDILGGQVDFICDQPASTISHIKAGNLKPIAVATKNRLKILPQVPTFSESGVPGFELTVWHGLYAPKGTPKDVTERLALSLREALKDPILIERFQEMSASIATPAQANPEALQSFLKADVERWKMALKAAGIQPE